MLQTILYVEDQERSRAFYELLFRRPADLHVPGMTEFRLTDSCKLGLMPNKGIAKILEGRTPHPGEGNGIPRCELYLVVADAGAEYDHALRCGGKPISPVSARDWGDLVGYLSDPDGHIIALAQRLSGA
ncbi:MAG TPA: VOC family protein [Flavobacteriales bacterium]|nr:VOC family protein [Flavobacteriales bacterium]